MRRPIAGLIAGASLVALLILGTASASPSHVPGGTIWVTERTPGGLSTVAAIDSRTGQSRGITPVGDAPIGITQPNGTNKVYSSDEAADQMSVIDAGHRERHPDDRHGRPVRPAPSDGEHERPLHLRRRVPPQHGRRRRHEARRERLRHRGERRHRRPYARRLDHANGKELYATNEGPVQNGPGTFSKIDVRTGRHHLGARGRQAAERGAGRRRRRLRLGTLRQRHPRLRHQRRAAGSHRDRRGEHFTGHVVADERRSDADRRPSRLAGTDGLHRHGDLRHPVPVAPGHDDGAPVALPKRRHHLHGAGGDPGEGRGRGQPREGTDHDVHLSQRANSPARRLTTTTRSEVGGEGLAATRAPSRRRRRPRRRAWRSRARARG